MIPPSINLGLQWEITEAEFTSRAWSTVLVTINGQPMHAIAYRVRWDDTTQVAFGDEFQDDVEKIQDISGGYLTTTELPGLEGDWIITILPHAN
jgi:hypothetical protein